MDLSRMENIQLDELFKLYVHECRLKDLAEVTNKGYEFAYKYFTDWIGIDITCNDVTQDLINEYVMYLKHKLSKPQTVNSYQFKISPVIKYGYRRGYIKDHIVFTHLVEQEYIKDIYTKDELQVILKKPKGSKASVKVPLIGWRSVEMKYADVLKNIFSLSANGNSYGIMRLSDIRSVEASPMNGVATLTDQHGNELVLMPEATKVIQPMPMFVYHNSSGVNNTLNLPAPVAEAGITIDYTDSLSNVIVTLPDGTAKEIVIVQEGVAEGSTKLYAMDYELDDTTKQMYIQIKNAMVRNYVLNYTESATDTNIYEIAQVPQIKDEQAIAVLNGDTATLSWEIEQPINGDVRYHLSMVELDNAKVVNIIPIYQDLMESGKTISKCKA